MIMTRLNVTLLLFLSFSGSLAAQNVTSPLQPIRELVTFETSSLLVKRLHNVADLLKEQEWEPAFKMMQQVIHEEGEILIPLHSRHYITASEYCQRMIAALPDAGVRFFRKQVDLQTKTLYETAQQKQNEPLLRTILRQAYVSSYGDDALWLLGKLAWERDEPAIARHYWEQLLPYPHPVKVGQPLPQLRYPDSQINRADLLSRLVLCSLAEGNRQRAILERRAFEKSFPQAKGTIAGQTGLLSKLLLQEIQKENQWSPVPDRSTTKTYGGNAHRNGIALKQVDIGKIQWKLPLPVSVLELIREQEQKKSGNTLSSHPVLFKEIILVNGDEEIFAYNIKTGLPWPDEKDETPLFSLSETTVKRQQNVIPLPAAGIPRQTMTVHQGYLYAKLGTPITSRPRKDQQLGNLMSQIVCLDLAKGEGKLVWNRSTKVLQKKNETEWMFEGAPIAQQKNLYIATRRGTTLTEAGIACFDANSGKLHWHKRVCSTVSLVGDSYSFISHQLLTLGNQTIFYSTNMGAIIALNADDGTKKWVMTYSSQRLKKPLQYNNEFVQSLTPCLYYQGIVIAAPNDSDQLFAMNASTGQRLWQQKLRGRVEHLLGVGKQGTLIASGNRLYGIDILSGKMRWNLGYEDPIGKSYGRGILADDVVYWSLREEIIVVKQYSKNPSSRIVQRIPLKQLQGESGGNLSIINHQLLITQPRHLILFSPFAGGTSPKKEKPNPINYYH